HWRAGGGDPRARHRPRAPSPAIPRAGEHAEIRDRPRAVRFRNLLARRRAGFGLAGREHRHSCDCRPAACRQPALPAYPDEGPRMIPAVILAGGRSTRLGGGDKCLLPLRGATILSHIIAALAPQTGVILINSNSDPKLFAQTGLAVHADAVPG